ncbi:MAG: hypothetical protein Q7R79_00855 [bacterium]|nr:hypothetical protein [bacterium]
MISRIWITRWRWALCVALFMLSIIIVDQNVPFAGEKILTYTFEKPHNVIGRFRPWIRYRELNSSDGTKIVKIVEDPVYFDIWTPVRYQRARIEFTYQNRSQAVLSVGLRRSASQWDIQLQEVQSMRKEGEWTVGYAEFDLSSVELQYQKYTFLISAPGLVVEKPERGDILLKKQEVLLKRDPLVTSLWKRINKQRYQKS